RPRNPFIIFRSAHAASVREQMRGSTQADISKYISALWAACSPTEKAHYERMAALEKEEHERKYPDYKFRP
ncbi:HMG-box, partial [Panus rudis PR-1116 ss-1]